MKASATTDTVVAAERQPSSVDDPAEQRQEDELAGRVARRQHPRHEPAPLHEPAVRDHRREGDADRARGEAVATPQSRSSCQGDPICVVSAELVAIVASAITITLRTPKRS